MNETPRTHQRRRAYQAGCVIALTLANGLILIGRDQDPKHSAIKGTVRTTANVIRIEVRSRGPSTYTLGDKPDLTLRLVDPKGQLFTATKTFPINIEVLSPEGKVVHTETVDISKGKSTEEFDLDVGNLPLVGALRIRATNPELLEGGTALVAMARPVRAPRPRTRMPSPPLDAQSWSERRDARAGDSVDLVLRARFDFHAPGGCPGDLIVSPGRAILADGRDYAELMLVVDPVERDTLVYLSTSLGVLTPNPVTIKAGTPVGSTRLTSELRGDATIECVRAVPALSGGSDDMSATVRFKTPLTRLDLAVTPPRIPWVDRAGIEVTLLRDDGRPEDTDEKRRISLSQVGSGEIQPPEVEIEPGEFSGRATFLPFEKGRVRIQATSTGFLRQYVELEVVALPYLMFLLPTLGGLCGGLAASMRQTQPESKRAPKKAGMGARPVLVRVGVGILTGTLLHWALVFNILPVLPRPVVMSVAGWFMVPVLGGWIGTEVFRALVNQLGLSMKPATGV